MFIIRYFFAIIIFSVHCVVFGKVSPLFLKGTYDCYQNSYKSIALPESYVVLDKIMPNVRIYGNMKRGEKGYAGDTGLDCIGRLMRTLFPSTTGTLSTQTSYSLNLGRYIKDPMIVAGWMQYVTQIRANASEDVLKKIQVSVEDKIKTNFKSNKEGRRVCGNLIKDTLNPFWEDLKEAALLKDSAYPDGFLEHLLQGFLLLHFDTQEDVLAYLTYLAEVCSDLVYKSKLGIQTPWNKQDVQSLLLKEDALSYEDKFLIGYANLFYSVVPYTSKQVIDNGLAKKFDGKNLKEETFADCVETACRHFLNLILYRSVENNFVLPKGSSIYLKEFYEKQSAGLVNNGSLDLRSLWNKVVASLNTDLTQTQILYTQLDSKNELEADLANILHVVRRVTGLHDVAEAYPREKGSDEDKKAWLVKYYQETLSVLNDLYAFEVEILDFSEKDSRKLCGGTLKVIAIDKAKHEQFRFLMDVNPGAHACFTEIVSYIDPEYAQLSKKVTANYSDTIGLKFLFTKDERCNIFFYDVYQLNLFDNRGIRFCVNRLVEEVKNNQLADYYKVPLSLVMQGYAWEDDIAYAYMKVLIHNLMSKNVFQPLMIALKKNILRWNLNFKKQSDFDEQLRDFINLKNLKISNRSSAIVISNMIEVAIDPPVSFNICYIDNLTQLERLCIYIPENKPSVLKFTEKQKKVNYLKLDMPLFQLDGLEYLENLTDLLIRQGETSPLKKITLTSSQSKLKHLKILNCKLDKIVFTEAQKNLVSLDLTSSTVNEISGLDLIEADLKFLTECKKFIIYKENKDVFVRRYPSLSSYIECIDRPKNPYDNYESLYLALYPLEQEFKDWGVSDKNPTGIFLNSGMVLSREDAFGGRVWKDGRFYEVTSQQLMSGLWLHRLQSDYLGESVSIFHGLDKLGSTFMPFDVYVQPNPVRRANMGYIGRALFDLDGVEITPARAAEIDYAVLTRALEGN